VLIDPNCVGSESGTGGRLSGSSRPSGSSRLSGSSKAGIHRFLESTGVWASYLPPLEACSAASILQVPPYQCALLKADLCELRLPLCTAPAEGQTWMGTLVTGEEADMSTSLDLLLKLTGSTDRDSAGR
jgi:hypothetical protein